ncbi:MAG: flagellar assembly peptidoglycan hydrolase FlgJ [Pseudomonadota bacterium]
MQQDISNASVYSSLDGLAKLRLAAKENSPEALKEVAEQFEAMFLQMLLKQMRDANLGDGLFDSDQTRFYQDMMDKEVAFLMSEKRGVGIADSMIRQLQHLMNSDQKGRQEKALDSITTNIFSHQQQSYAKFKSPQDYINTMRPFAEKAATKLGVPAHVLIAQSALETGWGQKVIRQPDGSSSHNLFGIKADARWQGNTVRIGSLEYRDGIPMMEHSNFRAYDSFEQSFNDYVEFIQSNERYQKALNTSGNGAEYIQSLQQAGYATDPHYAEKVIDIIQRQQIQG